MMLVIPLLLTGCHSRGEQQSLEQIDVALDTSVVVDSLNPEMKLMRESAVIKDRVEGIYRIVKSYYMSNGGAVYNEILDKCYCSKAWNKLLMAVRCKEQETSTLFFEVDYWAMTREPGFVSFDEFQVTDLTLGPEMRASVAFTVYELDTYTPARIDLVYEDGQWMIDNFYNQKYQLDVRRSMRYYLAHDVILM